MQTSEHIEKRLLEERARALRALQTAEREESTPPSESSGDVSRFHHHPADTGSETAEEESDFMMAARESRRVEQIDDALRALRSDPETFFQCERCGRPIEPERLEIVPWARLCSPCARSVAD